MGDDDYHALELSRRSIQISDLRAEVEDYQERIRTAEDRGATLSKNIGKIKIEIAIRKVKLTELEQRASQDAAAIEQAAIDLAADMSAGREEEEQLRPDYASAKEEMQLLQDKADEAGHGTQELEAQIGATNACLEARRLEVAHAHEEVSRAQADAKARQQAKEAKQLEEMTARLTEASTTVDTAAESARADEAESCNLSSALVFEKQSSQEIQISMDTLEEQSKQAEAQCSDLERELVTLGATQEADRLSDMLAASRQRYQHLSSDLSTAKRQAMLQVQSLQGAVDETRRMKEDHLDETRRHLDTTAKESPLASLLAGLVEAKAKSTASREQREQLDVEADDLQRNIQQVQSKLDDAQASSERAERAKLESELRTSRMELAELQRRNQQEEEAIRAATAATEQARKASQTSEQTLRSKLQELRQALQMEASKLDSQRFEPPARPSLRS